MELEITRENRVICEEGGNSDSGTFFLTSTKTDNRLSKDNLKFYVVRWVYGGGRSFKYPKIELSIGSNLSSSSCLIKHQYALANAAPIAELIALATQFYVAIVSPPIRSANECVCPTNETLFPLTVRSETSIELTVNSSNVIPLKSAAEWL